MGENTGKEMGENTGKWGEEQALAHLKANNYAILATNWHFKNKEIDIIAKIDGLIVFVEVKTRTSLEFGEPEDSVSIKKQRFLISAANHYLVSKEIDAEARFDIISILLINGIMTLKHIPEAFYPLAK
jgi:putative endonuclease